jgi:hypothetical protein
VVPSVESGQAREQIFMSDQQQPWNSQQVQLMQKRMQETLQTIIDQMDLRKWSVEKALASGGADDLIHRAESIYDFVVAPAADVRVTIE